MTLSRGRPTKSDKRISVTIIVKESVYDEYIKNNRPENTHNSKIERFMIQDNEANIGIENLKNKLAEKTKEISKIKVTIQAIEDQEIRINHRADNTAYQRDLYADASNLRRYSTPFKYLPDRAKILSKKYELPISITKADLEALLTHKNKLVETSVEYSMETSVEYSNKQVG